MYQIIYLRYGSFDTNKDPIRSYKEVGEIMGACSTTVHTAILRFESRGNKYVNLSKLTLGSTTLKGTH